MRIEMILFAACCALLGAGTVLTASLASSPDGGCAMARRWTLHLPDGVCEQPALRGRPGRFERWGRDARG